MCEHRIANLGSGAALIASFQSPPYSWLVMDRYLTRAGSKADDGMVRARIPVSLSGRWALMQLSYLLVRPPARVRLKDKSIEIRAK